MPRAIYPHKSIEEHFWSKVNITDFFECWDWLGYRNNLGYGRLSFKGRMTLAHRLSYTLSVGNIPDGLLCLHRCNNPACCNPAHLYIGTDQDNTNDKVKAHRQYAKLSEKQVVEIIRLLKTGATQRDIADRFSTSRANIATINTGLTWKYIQR
jgi:hypothetical protein